MARIPLVLIYFFLFPLPAAHVLTPGTACQTWPCSELLRASHIQAAPGWGSRCSLSCTTSSYKHHPPSASYSFRRCLCDRARNKTRTRLTACTVQAHGHSSSFCFLRAGFQTTETQVALRFPSILHGGFNLITIALYVAHLLLGRSQLFNSIRYIYTAK